MKIKTAALKALTLVSMTLIIATTAFAHSNHDHSTVPFKWQFSEKMYSKVERDLTSAKPNGVIGLNAFEQKEFNYYGIKVGNKFHSIIRNVNVTFERTSSGLKIVDASVFNKSMNDPVLPLKKVSKVAKVSVSNFSHAGHDHKRLGVVWNFGESTNSKIVKHMFQEEGKFSIGLSKLEQGLLTEYGIKPGNKFQLSISGHSFLVERTSGGIIILNHVENESVAKVDLAANMVEDKI